jgi:tRNA nucleotidyltransferase (CCA-adding enzyme)
MEINNKQVLKILSTLHRNGFKALIVGGAVRDSLQGLLFHDCDILTDAALDQINTIFINEKVKITGKSFQICLVNKIEICTARGKGNKTDFPEQDLGKRDFTINSMAFDPQNETIIDLFSGKEDLKNKIVRFTKDPCKRIEEDPLRIIRACRMASSINGSIEPVSKKALIENSFKVQTNVAKERIRLEIMKAMQHKTPSVFFRYLHEIDALKYIFPCLDKCFDLDGGPHHGETVFEHCMMTGDAISQKQPLLRLAAFLHDAGKHEAAIVKNGRLTFPGHENHTDKITSDLSSLRFSNKEIEYIVSITQLHMRPLKENTTQKAVRKILRDLYRCGIDFHDFLRIRIADKKANLSKAPYTPDEIKIRLKKILTEVSPDKSYAFTINDLAISGREIMEILHIAQSPKVGEVLNYLFEKVLDEPELNDKDKLEKLILEYR